MSPDTLYLLDTNVIIRNPELLAKKGVSIQVAIPRAVANELLIRTSEKTRSILEILLNAAQTKGVPVIETPSVGLDDFINHPSYNKLSGADLDILKIVKVFNSEQKQNRVVTDDKDLASVLIAAGYKILSANQFTTLIQSVCTYEDINIKNSAVNFTKYQRHIAIINLLFGAISSIIAFITPRHYEIILKFLRSTLPVWISCLLVTICGVLLFWFRQKFRSAYGILEVFVGVYAGAYPVFNHVVSSIGIAEGFQVLGGLYIIVRGMDNIGNGLKGTRFEPTWRLLFV